MAHPQEAKKGQVKVDAEYLKQIEGAHKELHCLLSKNTQFAPILLRLSFHDAGTYDARTKTGGVNGSIRNELSNPPNNGVINAIDFCEPVKAKFPKVTYADLYQLAGIVAVEVTGGPKIHFVPGRPDALQQQDTGDLPNPNGGKQHLKDIFHRMGFSDKDIVVLSGSHTLGRAHQERSGFDGPFTRQPLKFDNSYYRELLKGETPELIKFPTDNALLADPVFRGYVELYANDERAFFRDYAESHKKMSELGFHPNHHSNPHQNSQQQHCPQQNQQHCPQQNQHNQQQDCPQQQQQCVRPRAPCGYYAST